VKIIQHIALNCRDHKAQEQFYTRHFNFRRSRVFNAGQPDEFVMLRLGDTCLELFTARPEHRNQAAGPQPVGFSHLAFEVPDLDAAVAKLRADNIKTEEIIDCSWVTPGLRICFFHDPDGNRIELMQGYKDE